jgi:hypothetical protein
MKGRRVEGGTEGEERRVREEEEVRAESCWRMKEACG